LIVLSRLTDAPLSLDEHVAAVLDPAHGAVATFVGVVRDHDPAVTGRVVGLEYSAHPDAEAALAKLATTATPGDVSVAVSHRVGQLAVGEAAIVVAAAAAHRAEAFDACRAVVEAVKAGLPVWKRELLADGSHTWVGIR
jgi:molybdopterin synthase catalytic subunit